MNCRMTILCAAGLLALSACGGSEEKGNAASGEAKAPADSGAGEIAATLQPGEYEVTTQFVGIEAPNMPPEMANAMKGTTETKRSCITEDDLKEAKGGLFTGQEDKQCSENSMKLTGGRMTGSLKCGAGAESSTLTVDGRYTSQSYEAEMKMSAAGATTHIKMSAKRVGECPADQAAQG